MPKLIPPVPYEKFYGVVTSGHPLLRPVTAAKKCENFRVMPGQWLRLRSGRKAKMYNAAGSFLQFFETYKDADKVVQFYNGTKPTWQEFNMVSWGFDPFDGYDIDVNYGGSFASTEAAAIAQIQDRGAFYNGLGVRDASNSRPPFSSMGKYFGLDAYCPSGNPSAAFQAGAGYNTVVNSIQIFVGLYNTSTCHYSNGVYAGTIDATGATGTITVSNLANLKTAYHDAAEQALLKYVFYATIDGGELLFLILNANLNGPHVVAVTETSAPLSIYEWGNGWVLNLDAPMPTDNHPPRPMREIVYVNGRVYGITVPGAGSGSAVVQQRASGQKGLDFAYQPAYSRGLVYSKASSDVIRKNILGNPEECWPVNNFTETPTSEVPRKVAEAPDGYRILLITDTTTFLVEESVDGYHEWECIAPLHGISRRECFAKTSYGVAWLTQRNQIALLRKNSTHVEIISDHYQSLLSGKTGRLMAYIIDPLNEVDRLEVYCTDGTVVINDFALANEYFPNGQAYTSTGQDYTAAATLTDASGNQYHIAAKTNVYTREGQVEESGAVVTYDEDYTDADTKAKTDFSGEYERHWDAGGDDSLVKEVPHVDLIADQGTTIDWYADNEQVTDSNKKLMTNPVRVPQTETFGCFRYKLSKPHKYLLKLVFKLAGSYSKGLTYDHPSEQGSLASNFIGCIAKLKIQYGRGVNRP